MKKILFLMIIGVLIAGCSSTPTSNSGPISPITTAISTPIPSATVPTQIPTQNVSMIRSELDTAWRLIRVTDDTYKDDIARTTPLSDLATTSEISIVRNVIIPRTNSTFQEIKKNLTTLEIIDPGMNQEKTILLGICDYKITSLGGLKTAYGAIGVQYQDKDYKKALELYKSVKYSFLEVIDAIGILPYNGKYWDMTYDDKQSAENMIDWANEHIDEINRIIY
jgi:hypothetical protein